MQKWLQVSLATAMNSVIFFNLIIISGIFYKVGDNPPDWQMLDDDY